MNTSTLYAKAQKLGAGFVANVIVNWHSKPTTKLRGLVRLLESGHCVSLPHDLDNLVIDGRRAAWSELEVR